MLFAAVAAAAEPRPQLVVWGLDTQSEWRRGAQVLVELFEQRHNVDIVSFSPGTSSAQKALSAIAGGVPPDVMGLGTYTKDWVARGVVRPLDDWIARDADGPYAIRLDQYYPASLEHVRFQESVYAIPDWSIPMALYYNRDLLRQAGFVDAAGDPLPPATWEQWFDYNRQLSRRDEAGNFTRIGCYPGPYVPSLYTLTRQLGGHFLSDDGRTFHVDGQPTRDALAWLLRFTDYFGGRRRLDAFRSSEQFAGIDPLFVGGEVMRIEGQWYITNFARFGPDVDYDVSPMPHFEGHPRVDFQLTTSWGIPHDARQPELAWELIKWLTSVEAQRIKVHETIEFTRNRGQPFTPFTTANRRINQAIEAEFVRHNPVFPERTRRAYARFTDILETATWLRPVNTPVGQLMDDELRRAYDAASLHTATADEALQRARSSVQHALDLYWQEKSLPRVTWRPVLAIGLLLLVCGGGGLWLWLQRCVLPLGPRGRRETLAGVAFVSPWIVGFLALLAGPMVASILLSFTRYSVLRPPRWVGLDNYRELLLADPLVWKSLGNTAFMMLGVPAGMAVGLAIAILLNRAVRGVAVYRTIYYLPAVLPAVASAILWTWMFHPTSGLVNAALAWVGIDGPLWLQSQQWAKPAILLFGLWGAGGSMIIWLAGLRGIPEHLYEAAQIDGASTWARFRYITLPMLTPYLFFNLVMGCIGTLQIFTQAVVMTKGGPLDATLFYVYYLFNNAFEYFRMGYASAMAWILFLVILAITVVQLRLAPRWVYYEGETR